MRVPLPSCGALVVFASITPRTRRAETFGVVPVRSPDLLKTSPSERRPRTRPHAISVGLSGAILIILGRLSATGRLPRNPLAGIRIPSTMRNDAAWRAGHVAAGSALGVAGLGPLTVALVVGVTRPSVRNEAALFRAGSLWLVAWLAIATSRARRAARAENRT